MSSNDGGSKTDHRADIPVFEYSPGLLTDACNSWSDPAPVYSTFDNALIGSWDSAMANGLFRYDLSHISTRVLPGSMAYVAQLNTKRATDRRKPDEMLSLNQPFDVGKFNFTKLPPKEVLFELYPQETATSPLARVNPTEERSPVLRCRSKIEERHCEHHLVAINVSPLEYGHVLLIPQVDSCHNQNLTLTGISLALDMILLSSHRGFRLGFNSLCAYASVNHQHLHGYYLDYKLYIESAGARQLCPGFYEMTSTPTTGFGFQLKGSSKSNLARMIFFATDYLRKNEVAHCLFITRGQSLDEEEEDRTSTVRAVLWPRRSVFGAKPSDAAFSSAVVELAGHLLVKDVALYETMTEEYATSVLQEASLQDHDFARIRQHLVDGYSRMDL